jgi:hypothetical protein
MSARFGWLIVIRIEDSRLFSAHGNNVQRSKSFILPASWMPLVFLLSPFRNRAMKKLGISESVACCCCCLCNALLLHGYIYTFNEWWASFSISSTHSKPLRRRKLMHALHVFMKDEWMNAWMWMHFSPHSVDLFCLLLFSIHMAHAAHSPLSSWHMICLSASMLMMLAKGRNYHHDSSWFTHYWDQNCHCRRRRRRGLHHNPKP